MNEQIQELADKLVEAAKEGDLPAVVEIRKSIELLRKIEQSNRIEGKINVPTRQAPIDMTEIGT